MRRNVLFISIISIFLFCSCSKTNDNNEKNDLTSLENQIVGLSKIVDTYISFETMKVPLENKVNDFDGKKIQINCEEIGKILFFYFNELICTNCLLEQFDLLKELKSAIIYKIIFLASYSNYRQLSVMVKQYNLDNEVWLIDPFSLQEDFTRNAPFYFRLDNNFRIINLFSPIKNLNGWTEKYLLSINSKIF
jgi:hypothetical protein